LVTVAKPATRFPPEEYKVLIVPIPVTFISARSPTSNSISSA